MRQSGAAPSGRRRLSRGRENDVSNSPRNVYGPYGPGEAQLALCAKIAERENWETNVKTKIVSGSTLAVAAIALALGGTVATPALAKHSKHQCNMEKGQCGGKAKCMTKKGACKHQKNSCSSKGSCKGR